jgi:hypothetical protein
MIALEELLQQARLVGDSEAVRRAEEAMALARRNHEEKMALIRAESDGMGDMAASANAAAGAVADINAPMLKVREGAESVTQSLKNSAVAASGLADAAAEAQAKMDAGGVAALKLGDATAAAYSGINQLDRQTLERIRAEFDETAYSADQLTKSLESTIDRLQDSLDRRAGNDMAIAERDHQRELIELQEIYYEASIAGDTETMRLAQEAMALMRQDHAENMENMRVEYEYKQNMAQLESDIEEARKKNNQAEIDRIQAEIDKLQEKYDIATNGEAPTPRYVSPSSGSPGGNSIGPAEARPITRPIQADHDSPTLSRATPERTFRLDLNIGGQDIPLYGDAELAAIVAEQLEVAQRRAL